MNDVYVARFTDHEHLAKDAAWKAVADYLSRWIDEARPIVDIGCDRGYFIRQVAGVERWGVDTRDVGSDLPGVRFVQADGLEPGLPLNYFGTVFMSNLLEHLRNGDEVIRQLEVARSILADGGRVIVLQPNIRFVGASYWDFIDHRVALTERSLVEAGSLAGLATEKLIPRFLPYTTKSRWPVNAALTSAYLHMPLAWRLLGKQTLWVARAQAHGHAGG